ncbi:MAG: phosphoribosylglycinamide formyltransferase [Chitinophagales bacterium]
MSKQKKRIAIFISGRGSNMTVIAQNVASGILQNCCEIVLVFSNKHEAKGLATAQEMGLPTHCIPSRGKKRIRFDQSVVNYLQTHHTDLDYIVLAGYMRILSKPFIEHFKGRIINIHPADTQAHKGLHAYDWAYEFGLKNTKITVHYVDEGMDTGQIIAQSVVDLQGVQSLEEVEKRGLAVEHQFYSQVLKQVFEAS